VRENVLIPLSLLDRLIDLLEYWNIREYDPSIRDDYYDILATLQVKKQKLELRDAYAKIIQADNPDDQHEARMRYLQLKRWIDQLGGAPF